MGSASHVKGSPRYVYLGLATASGRDVLKKAKSFLACLAFRRPRVPCALASCVAFLASGIVSTGSFY